MSDYTIYDVRFVIVAKPGDIVIPKGSRLYFDWRYRLDKAFREVKRAVREGKRADLKECVEWMEELKRQVWDPPRATLVKRPVR